MKYDIKNIKLASQGKKRIEWAEKGMPVLGLIKKRFALEKPLRGKKIAACLHVTSETANLARTLKEAGARVVLCASNPLSTQDEVASSLVKDFGISVFARRGEGRTLYYKHLRAALAHQPEVTLDDGADLISLLHSRYQSLAQNISGSMEETTTGVIRLRALEKSGQLKIPVIAVNDAKTKNLFDNRYGTGQSTLDGIIRATDVLIAGQKVVVAGYGWCGKGFAMRARGMGAQVIVTETDPLRALEAVMDGYQVMPMREAAKIGDIFCTLTGDIKVLSRVHFLLMKDGAIIANSGHFDVEIDIPALGKLARKVRRNVKDLVDEYTLKNGRRIYLLGQGRLINLAAAHGHPAQVMDMSFATQALAAEWVVENKGRLAPRVWSVPAEIEAWISRLKLKSMGVKIDRLLPAQKKYLASWEMGT